MYYVLYVKNIDQDTPWIVSSFAPLKLPSTKVRKVFLCLSLFLVLLWVITRLLNHDLVSASGVTASSNDRQRVL